MAPCPSDGGVETAVYNKNARTPNAGSGSTRLRGTRFRMKRSSTSSQKKNKQTFVRLLGLTRRFFFFFVIGKKALFFFCPNSPRSLTATARRRRRRYTELELLFCSEKSKSFLYDDFWAHGRFDIGILVFLYLKKKPPTSFFFFCYNFRPTTDEHRGIDRISMSLKCTLPYMTSLKIPSRGIDTRTRFPIRVENGL